MNTTMLRRLSIPGVLLLLTFLAFGRSLTQGFSPIDDSFLLLENLAIRGLTWENVKTVFTTYDPELYIPLIFLSFQTNYALSGLAPFGYHLANLLIHALNAVLVYWLLAKLMNHRILAAFGALLFVVHPLHTEAVVWIAGRKDLLSTMFTLGALFAYVRYSEIEKGGRGNDFQFFASLLLFFLALLSKAMAVTLPAILLLYDLTLGKRPLTKNLLLEKIPFIALSALFMIIATGGKERVIGSVTLWEIILMAGRSSVFYIQKLFLPTDLSVFYPHRGPITIIDPQFLIPGIIVLVASIIILVAFVRSCFTNSSDSSDSSVSSVSSACFGFFFMLLTLAPTFLNFHKGSETFYAVDRYAYLPSIGMMLTVLPGIGQILHFGTLKHRISGIGHRLLAGLAACLIVAFTVLSRHQTAFWDTPEKLFGHALEIHPESLSARVNLAKMLREQGKLQEAFDLLKEGLKYGDDAHLHLAAGAIFARAGRAADAAEEFRIASKMNPLLPEPDFSLGSLMEQLGDPLEARHWYARAVGLDPSYVIARTRLASLLIESNEIDAARAQLAAALAWNPNSAEGHIGMARIFFWDEKTDEARLHLEKALALNPTNREARELAKKFWQENEPD